MPKLTDLSPEQRLALYDYRAEWLKLELKPDPEIRTWKAQLLADWLEAKYFWTHWQEGPRNYLLQRIRNQYGPTWLDKLKESEFDQPLFSFDEIVAELSKYSYEDLDEMETLKSGQYSNLKIKTPHYAVWLDRSSITAYFDALGDDAPTRVVIVVAPTGARLGCYLASGENDGYNSYRHNILQQENQRS
jgi:hypothetical protein